MRSPRVRPLKKRKESFLEKIRSFQITSMTISGFKSYQEPTELVFGNPTVITGGNGRGKPSVADAIAFTVTGLPFFGERGIDRLHNEENPDVYIAMRFVEDIGKAHELIRTRQNNKMRITYDSHEIPQLDLKDLFGEPDVFLSILNPFYFIEELGDKDKSLLEMYLPELPVENVLKQLPPDLALALKGEPLLSPETHLKKKRADVRNLEESILYMQGQRDQAEALGETRLQMAESASKRQAALQEELTALEEKQFAGLDVPALREQLVDLSARYEEALRDNSGREEQNQLHVLREKIVERQAEQYRSKYAPAPGGNCCPGKKPGAALPAGREKLSVPFRRESLPHLPPLHSGGYFAGGTGGDQKGRRRHSRRG